MADQNIIVKEHGIFRIQTGIPGFDKLLEGGFVKNSAVMVQGDTGTAKTLFCLQYLYSGVTLFKEPGVFISFAESEEAIYQHGQRFGWDLPKLTKENMFSILRYAPHEVAHVMSEGGGSIRDAVESLGAKRLVIDSLTAYEMFFDSKYRANQSVLDLFELLRQWNTTALVTSEFPISFNRRSGGRLGFLTDGIINLYHIRTDVKVYRALEIIKMRDTDHYSSMHCFSIGKKGLTVSGELKLCGKK